MKALLIQPPFAQLNAPYPAIHYLEAFLIGRGVEAESRDHSIVLYRKLFSRDGLLPVFAAARERLGAALDARPGSAPREAPGAGPGAAPIRKSSTSRSPTKAPSADSEARAQLERYLSYEELYLAWIGPLVAFLSGQDPSFAHRVSSAVELPRGMRAEALLRERDGRVGVEEARLLATRILEDLGDLVAFAYDPLFATVRYAERIASSRSSLAEILSSLDSSRLMRELYDPLLQAEFAAANGAPDLLLITIPFPGSLLGALACARAARRVFGGATSIAFGGGYVSTELRGLRDSALFDYCDYLAFDAGYGALESLLETLGGASRERLYRCMYRDGRGGIVCAGFPPGDSARAPAPRAETAAHAEAATRAEGAFRPLILRAEGAAPPIGAAAPGAADPFPPRAAAECDAASRIAADEGQAVRGVFPDYRSADFGLYLRVVDSDNPMHRLWSDAPWLKYHLARGCYWRRCAFCDTELEYVSGYAPSSIGALLAAAEAASARSGLYGIHFVDEAMPMPSLLAFARENRLRETAGQRPFHFWGNVRFDASWTEGRSAYLAAAGLVAVSGGIEIATERGLAMTDKGFDLGSLVRSLVALRRSGILVHAYLIYGFPGQEAMDIVDSAEVCRQLFASGLIDSAFWHRFVLTRHSAMNRERASGGRPGLLAVDKSWSFANNDLAFVGEKAYDRYEEPLAASLAAWMAGQELDRPATTWFGARSARSGVLPDLVESLIARAETALDRAKGERKWTARWIAGTPSAYPTSRGLSRLTWVHRGELRQLELPSTMAAKAAAAIGDLGEVFPERSIGDFAASAGLGEAELLELRESGLVAL